MITILNIFIEVAREVNKILFSFFFGDNFEALLSRDKLS